MHRRHSRFPGQDIEGHLGQGPDIRRGPCSVSCKLLGGGEPHIRHACLASETPEAIVGNDGTARVVIDQNVAGVQVEVVYALLVQVPNGVDHLYHDPEGPVQRDGPMGLLDQVGNVEIVEPCDDPETAVDISQVLDMAQVVAADQRAGLCPPQRTRSANIALIQGLKGRKYVP